MTESAVASTSSLPKRREPADTAATIDPRRYFRGVASDLTNVSARVSIPEPSTRSIRRVPATPGSLSVIIDECIVGSYRMATEVRPGPLDVCVVQDFPTSGVECETATVALLDAYVTVRHSRYLSTLHVQRANLDEQGVFEGRIRELERLTAQGNWDLEGGREVPRMLWMLAREVYAIAKQSAAVWLEPFVSPSGDGTVHLTWVRNGGRLNLEIGDGADWHVAVKSGPGLGYRKSDVSPSEAVAELRAFLA